MNGFTSGTQARDGRKINHDPYPNVWEGHSPRNRMRADTDMFRKGAPFNHERYRYLPRPEFDVLDNPILAAFRVTWQGQLDMLEQAEFLALELGDAGLWPDDGYTDEYTREQIDHARRVLDKLVAVYA